MFVTRRDRNLLTVCLVMSALFKIIAGLRMPTEPGKFVGASLRASKRIFDEPDVSLAGRTSLITGANSGLGREAAIKLCALGSKVVLLCRNPALGEAAVKEVKAKAGPNGGSVSFVPLDLASLASIDACVARLQSEVRNVDVLMNNAGVMAVPTREQTVDGFETQIGVNHLGHYYLTAKLWNAGLIAPSPANGNRVARVVNVASTAHFFGELETAMMDNDLLLARPGAYSPWGAYGNSKLANVLFTRELAARLRKAGRDDVVTFSLHPGVCRTDLWRYIAGALPKVPRGLLPVVGLAALPVALPLAVPVATAALTFTKSSKEGAQTQIYLAASNKLDLAGSSGEYHDNFKVATTSDSGRNPAVAAWLWQQSEALTGAKFDGL
jgi:NAD(P)-dependent dehydrogenase (short-subunit alcohol dehydrogenase family)